MNAGQHNHLINTVINQVQHNSDVYKNINTG